MCGGHPELRAMPAQLSRWGRVRCIKYPGAGSRRSRNPQELNRYPAAMAIDGVRVKRIAP